jgi:hypothetical protein
LVRSTLRLPSPVTLPTPPRSNVRSFCSDAGYPGDTYYLLPYCRHQELVNLKCGPDRRKRPKGYKRLQGRHNKSNVRGSFGAVETLYLTER